ncbi:hypothetical protein ACHAWX_004564 [Stephanocyclus meneghinianus]
MTEIVQRRGQKLRQRTDRESYRQSAKRNLEVVALTQKIRRLDTAKRKLHVIVKFILCAVVLGRGYSIFTKASGRRRRQNTGTAGWFNAFQHVKVRKNNGRMIDSERFLVPKELMQPFGAYPNIFNITQEMRHQFHPVVKFPRRKNLSQDDSTCISHGRKLNETFDYIVKDFTGKGATENTITVGGKKLPQLLPSREEAIAHAKAFPNPSKGYDIGRYDEDRQGMYTSSLFVDGNNGTGMRRTLHVGLDIGAPVGTEVYAFEDGVVHSVGYNPDVGDYGHVIVIEHTLSSRAENGRGVKVYALYGHLAKCVINIQSGDKITKGQVIGRIGNTDENGGWTGAHLHFQVAVNPPMKEHDMPGTVTLVDRDVALLEYADPRYILGELY